MRPFYVAPAPVAYASPPAVYASVTPTYAAPTTYAAPSAQRVLIAREVVVHAHGRYVLLGDGVTSPTVDLGPQSHRPEPRHPRRATVSAGYGSARDAGVPAMRPQQ